ncbi:STAS domain-containing protein [Polynucleobacter sp. AP-Feld-500C-C5]|uniref:STAS domain-containing protein n=1 Tax=Polynucleobacter sp. AP-Feld-500C-C5 TaxID=2576924 RepID=UPI0021046EB4|nr:STAS domain-containing protein [Polynucleobacter sp. AP-Feld-500C-C5]
MGEWKKFVDLKQFRLPYQLTIVSVFLLTVILDLTVAVQVGLLFAFITFIYRISSLSRCELADASNFSQLENQQGRIDAYRIYGAIFFGAVKLLEKIEEKLPSQVLLIDLKNVIYVDTSGMETITGLAHLCKIRNIKLIICGLEHQPYEMAQRSGFLQTLPSDCLYPDLLSGIAAAIQH